MNDDDYYYYNYLTATAKLSHIEAKKKIKNNKQEQAYLLGYEQTRQQAIDIVKPKHTTNGNNEDGCPHLCEWCKICRRHRDVIKEMKPLKEINK